MSANGRVLMLCAALCALVSLAHSGAVGFSAHLNEHHQPTAVAGQTIVFQNVIENRGYGYNKATGEFTAPQDGLYFFIVQINCDTAYDRVAVQKNGQRIFDADRDDTYSTAMSGSAVMYLRAGDKVKAVNFSSGGRLEGGVEATFTGFLVG